MRRLTIAIGLILALQTMPDFIRTTAINKIKSMSARKKVIPGGTSAGKTFGILPILIDQCAKNPGLEVSVVSESIPHLRKGAIKDFLKIMKATRRYFDDRWNRTHLTYTFANGSYIEFFSAEDESRVRGPRRNVLYINEATNLRFDTYHQLAIRTNQDIFIDFNPSEEFWAHEELPETEPDVEWLTLTYKDNEALDNSIIAEIEKAKAKAKTSSYWGNWWKVYGLGQLGSLEGVIFENWKTIDKVPTDGMIGYGLDFGYSNDPTALIACYKVDGKIIFDEVIYETGLLNSDIAKLAKANGIQKYHYGIADSAEPKSIAELNRSGLTIKPASKGKDSINFGIDLLQAQEFYITSKSTNLIKEMRSYRWDSDKHGNYLKRPIDAFNHGIDAMRYLAMEKLTSKKSGMRIYV